MRDLTGLCPTFDSLFHQTSFSMRIGQVMAFVNLPCLVQFRTPTAGYQALRESEMREDVETAHRPLTPAVQSLAGSIQWAPMCRLSAFYGGSPICVTFRFGMLANCLQPSPFCATLFSFCWGALDGKYRVIETPTRQPKTVCKSMA